ncbi:MAG: SDR family NAD(P)-dependent oxidoreductase [Pseudomonadales bacterium]|nr:SDR family NAD(P)-dependent oxidoreductase [Halieaceae bacterium]MCP5164516.1 SDR family NAD(P)-dependent oxidoreductase [Pseudomonadales bacterium]MCP5190121.1 SDR family NAD(P)-dependent oxidoreductase [Pseudomonadales bacterium]MCP5204348.1 SDR family NAD(P)-dependent oxidoreductase [Pseudomonadales bacterium]
MDNSGLLQGRVAIVTGAGKGLGRAWALQLAAQGARVVVNNRSRAADAGPRSADAVVTEIQCAGGEAVANHDSVEAADTGSRLVEQALQHFGRLDIVVANAGIDCAASFHKLALADFERVMEVNFHGVARLLHAAWPVLRAQTYGRVLVSGSTAGLYGNHGQAAYASAKAALQGLVKTLAIEGRSRGVLVNLLAPYAVTQLTHGAFPAAQVAQFSAEAVAPLVAWLVTEHCRLTGQVIIAGAGGFRQVRTLESDTLVIGDDIPDALERLQLLACSQAPESASAEFENFSRSMANTPE